MSDLSDLVLGVVQIQNGGTNTTTTPTAGAVAYGTGTAYAFTAAGSSGQFLTSSGSGTPTWSTVSSSTGSPTYYGNFYDVTNQSAANTTTAYVINIGNNYNTPNGISIQSGNQITIQYAGVYVIEYGLQFANSATASGNFNVDVWIRKNGTDIANSNTIYTIPNKSGSTNGALVGASAFIVNASAGDYFQLVFAVSNTTISIETIAAQTGPTIPVTPSVIVSVYSTPQIGIGYAGLTSTTSLTIATGTQNVTTNLNANTTAFTVGTRVRLSYPTNTADYMEGAITSFSGTAMVVNVDAVGGSGTFASWNISVAGIAGTNTSVPGTNGQVLTSNGSSGFGTPFSLATGVQTFLTTPSSANLATAVTDETGTGALVFSNTPALITPAIGSGGYTVAGSTSGTTTVQASAVASGTVTLPAATDTLVGKATTDMLTNKTISGASNTLSNIANASLTNSSVTVNGSSISLGGSATITAANPNALTIGTGLSGTSYTGASAVTIAIDSTVATLTGVQTLTNKTLTTPAIQSSGFTIAGSTSGTTTVVASATASGTITVPAATDTLVGKATTDTFTNKTFDTAGTGNSFKINGTAITAVTGSGSAVLGTGPSISNLTVTGTLTAGGSAGTNGYYLQSTGTGVQWASVAAGGGYAVLSKTAAYTVATSDGTNVLVKCSASGGAFTVTLYTAVGNTGNAVTVKKTDSSTNAITIATTSSQTIDGATTQTINSQYTSFTMVSDGSNWNIV